MRCNINIWPRNRLPSSESAVIVTRLLFFCMNENSVTSTSPPHCYYSPPLPSPHFHYLTTTCTLITFLLYHQPYHHKTHPHYYCFTNTTTTTKMSLRYRNEGALKNAMIEEGVQFMTLELQLKYYCWLVAHDVLFPLLWVNQLGSLCSGTCLSLLQCSFVMVFQWNCPNSRPSLEGRGKRTRRAQHVDKSF